MNQLSLILSILGVVAIAGAAWAYFKRSAGRETISLLQTNIEAYKDAEAQKNSQIASLKVQLQIRDDTIERLVASGRSNKKSRN